MRIIFMFIFFFCAQIIVAQSSSIIVSPVGPQTAYEGSRISVYFATLKHFDTIDISSTDMPDFGTLSYEQSGNGKIIFDTEKGDAGNYTINVELKSGSLSNSFSFKLSVLAIDDTASTIFYIDPATGSNDATGTENDPFASLETFFETKRSLIDDQTYIFLKSGFHGTPVFTGTRDKPVRILAASGHTPRVKRLNFSFTTNWYVSGLDISPQNENKVDTETLINVFAGSKFIEITNCNVYSIDDASVWTTNEMWYEGSGNGILSSGTECTFKNNFFKNTWFTVEMRKASNEFSYNIIDRFGADAVRALADNQKVNYNQIKNATIYDYDHPTRPQHDDGIQSYTFNNPIKSVEIIGNQIADIADPNLNLPTEVMQGIVDFDGFAEDWTVTNNLIITHHAHGIALYGAKNCNVSNNTVTRNPFNYFSPQFKPWIRVNPRKETVGGDHSLGNLVRNNIMSSYQDEGLEPATFSNNLVTQSYTSVYADYSNWDFHLSSTSAAIDAGSFTSTPSIDQESKLRNVGLPDIGCYERGATITDLESPTRPSNIQIESGFTYLILNWDLSTDNTGIAYYETTINDNNSYISESNTIKITSLEPGNEYEIDVIAVDNFGNKSSKGSTMATTNYEELMMVHYVSAHRHDQLIKSNQKLMWVGMPSLLMGDYLNGLDAASVIPFQLPCLSDNRSIVSADILLHLESIEGNPLGEVDLYLIEMRAKSDVLATDFYSGPSEDADSGMLIAEKIMDTQSPMGLTTLSSNQQSALNLELNTLYDNSACNKFAFFRLNSNVVDEPSESYYSIASFDNIKSDQRPLLKIVSNAPSSTSDVEVQDGLKVSPNPSVDSNITFSIDSKFNSVDVILEIHNVQGQKVYSKMISGPKGSIEISAEFTAGIYYATILGKDKFAQTKFIKL